VAVLNLWSPMQLLCVFCSSLLPHLMIFTPVACRLSGVDPQIILTELDREETALKNIKNLYMQELERVQVGSMQCSYSCALGDCRIVGCLPLMHISWKRLCSADSSRPLRAHGR